MSDALQDTTLVAATVALGVMAGVFGLYAHTIMPGLGRTDDRTFVGAFQAIDRAIINPWFIPVFLGALVLTAAAGLLRLDGDGTVLALIASAFVLYLAVVLVTMGINVPQNNTIKAAGEPDRIDVAAVRARFDEAKWIRWNVFRAFATTAAAISLAAALAVQP
jgi:uncharacterized membrane protein